MQKTRYQLALGLCLAVGLTAQSQAGRVEWVPVSATGSHTINGNEIIILDNPSGIQVTLELRVSDWDPDHDGMPLLGAVQATLDSAGYVNGSGTNLAPLSVPNVAAGGFVAVNRCSINQQESVSGAPCGTGFGGCPVGEFCVSNPAYIFTCCSPLPVLALVSPNYEYGSVALSGYKMDDGLNYYLGTLIVVVPPAAKGIYTLGFKDDSNFTFMADQNGVGFDVDQQVPATIKIFCANDAECFDNNPCTNDRCSSSTCFNNARPAGFSCSDGLFCTGTEVCDGAKVCMTGSIPCTGLPGATCDEIMGCVGKGNFNGDNSLNSADWMDFADCLSGPNVPNSGVCTPAQMDNGTDVDLMDGALFFNFFTGP